MEKWIVFLVLGGLLLSLVRLMMAPVRLVWKLAVNGLAGLACLWILNLAAGITGLYIPINPITAVVAGALGLPGMALLAVVQLWL